MLQEQKQAPKTDHPVPSADWSASDQRLMRRARRFKLDLGGREIPPALAARFLEDLTIPEIMRMRQVNRAWNEFILHHQFARRMIIKKMGTGYLWQILLENPSQLTLEQYFRDLFLTRERYRVIQPANFHEQSCVRGIENFYIPDIEERVQVGDFFRFVAHIHSVWTGRGLVNVRRYQWEGPEALTLPLKGAPLYLRGENVMGCPIDEASLAPKIGALIEQATSLAAIPWVRDLCRLTDEASIHEAGSTSTSETQTDIMMLYRFLIDSLRLDRLLFDIAWVSRIQWFTALSDYHCLEIGAGHISLLAYQLITNEALNGEQRPISVVPLSPVGRLTREGILLCNHALQPPDPDGREPYTEEYSPVPDRFFELPSAIRFKIRRSYYPHAYYTELTCAELEGLLAVPQVGRRIDYKAHVSFNVLTTLRHYDLSSRLTERGWQLIYQFFNGHVRGKRILQTLKAHPHVFLMLPEQLLSQILEEMPKLTVDLLKHSRSLQEAVVRMSDDNFIQVMTLVTNAEDCRGEIILTLSTTIMSRFKDLTYEGRCDYFRGLVQPKFGIIRNFYAVDPALIDRQVIMIVWERLFLPLSKSVLLDFIMKHKRCYKLFSMRQLASLVMSYQSESNSVSTGDDLLAHRYFLTDPEYNEVRDLIAATNPTHYSKDYLEYLAWKAKENSQAEITHASLLQAKSPIVETTVSPRQTHSSTFGEIDAGRRLNRQRGRKLSRAGRQKKSGYARVCKELLLWTLPLLVTLLIAGITGGVDYLLYPMKPFNFLRFMTKAFFGFNLWIAGGILLAVAYTLYALIRFVPWQRVMSAVCECCCSDGLRSTYSMLDQSHSVRNTERYQLLISGDTDKSDLQADSFMGPLDKSISAGGSDSSAHSQDFRDEFLPG